MKKIIGFASFLFLVLLAVLPANASFAAAATNANLTGVSLFTDKQGEIKATGTTNHYTLDLIGVPGNTEVQKIQFTSDSLNADSISDVKQNDPIYIGGLHFVNKVAYVDKAKLLNWFSIAENAGYQEMYNSAYPNEATSNNLFSVQDVRDYYHYYGNKQTGYVADKAGNETPFTLTVLMDGWKLANGKWYDYTEQGTKITGWVYYGGQWYFLDKNTGAMVTNAWVKDGAKWYYLNANGTMKTGWFYYGKKWYYLTKSGAMATNAWVYDAGKWYYMDANGVMKTGWVLVGKKWYFLYNDGHMAANTKIGSYRLGNDGAWIH